MLLELNYEGIDFPVSVKHYNRVEIQNLININVFGYENKQFYPIYVSKENNEDVLHLLLITKDENQHYVLITDFNKLMFNKTKHKEQKYFCMHCLQCFSSQDVLTEVVCCYDDHYTKPAQIYRGEKPIKKFMEEMLKEAQ